MSNNPDDYDAYLEQWEGKTEALADCETKLWSAINKCLTELKTDGAFSAWMTDTDVQGFKLCLTDTMGDFFHDGKKRIADQIDSDRYDADAVVSDSYKSNPDKDSHPDHIIEDRKP